MQVTHLHPQLDDLHAIHGSKTLTSIYGAGQVNNPNICLIFMNPTAKNVSANPNWNGLRAPWIGTKKVWQMLHKVGLFSNAEMVEQITKMPPQEWTPEFAEDFYQEIANNSLYITNTAKCTQDDARPLSDAVYREYLPLMLEELEHIQPKLVIAMGNQVNSILLGKPISVSNYLNDEYEELNLPSGKTLKLYPTYYPVGQGTPNLPKAISRINSILYKHNGNS